MTTRRSFLGSILAAATPPGFVRAGVLMPVVPVIAHPPGTWILPRHVLEKLTGASPGQGVSIRLLTEGTQDRQWVRLESGAWVSESTLRMLAREFALAGRPLL